MQSGRFTRKILFVHTTARLFSIICKTENVSQRRMQMGFWGGTVQRFMEYGVRVTTTGTGLSAVTESLNGRASICIMLALFGVGGLINDCRYVDGDEEFEDWKKTTWGGLANQTAPSGATPRGSTTPPSCYLLTSWSWKQLRLFPLGRNSS